MIRKSKDINLDNKENSEEKAENQYTVRSMIKDLNNWMNLYN